MSRAETQPETIYDRDLDPTPANYVPLSPISFLERAAGVYPDRVAIIHGDRRITYAQFLERVRRFASALKARGIGRGDTVSVMALNTPALLEAHYAVPMTGAVLNAINTRLDAATVAFILKHGEAKAVFSDRELNPIMQEALAQLDERPGLIVDIDDAEAAAGELIGEISPKHIFDEADRTAFRDAVHSVLCVNLAMLVDEGVLDFDSRGVEDLSWALTQTIEEYALSRATEPPDRTVAGRTATVVDLTRARLARGG